MVDAVKSFKHDRARYLEYLRTHQDVLARAQKAISAAACKMRKNIDYDDLAGLAKTMSQAVLQSLIIILNELESVRN